MSAFSAVMPACWTAPPANVEVAIRKQPKQPRDSLWQPGDDGDVRGGQGFIRRSLYTAGYRESAGDPGSGQSRGSRDRLCNLEEDEQLISPAAALPDLGSQGGNSTVFLLAT